MQRMRLQVCKDFTAARTTGRWNRQQHLAGAGFRDQLWDVFGLVDLQAGDHLVGDGVIVVDECHGAYRSPHTQCRNQLISCRPGTVNDHLGQAIIMVEAHGELG
ncbi:hypothetical protein D3C78_1172930 [compost metagenome]